MPDLHFSTWIYVDPNGPNSGRVIPKPDQPQPSPVTALPPIGLTPDQLRALDHDRKMTELRYLKEENQAMRDALEAGQATTARGFYYFGSPHGPSVFLPEAK